MLVTNIFNGISMPKSINKLMKLNEFSSLEKIDKTLKNELIEVKIGKLGGWYVTTKSGTIKEKNLYRLINEKVKSAKPEEITIMDSILSSLRLIEDKRRSLKKNAKISQKIILFLNKQVQDSSFKKTKLSFPHEKTTIIISPQDLTKRGEEDRSSKATAGQIPNEIMKITEQKTLLKIPTIDVEKTEVEPLKTKEILKEVPVLFETKNIIQIDLDPTSSVVFNKNTNQFLFISPALPIKNIVISGGGAKGIILPGVLKALEEYKSGDVSFMNSIDNVAGSSIGAITALVIAAGMSAEDFINLSKATDFDALLGTYRGLFSDKRGGEHLLGFMQNMLQVSIKKNLMNILKVDDFSVLEAKSSIEKLLKMHETKQAAPSNQEKEAIINKIQSLFIELNKENSQDVCITFSMLDVLRKLEPSIFKSLTVTAVCAENGEICYFNATNTPDLDIALACKASAAVPYLLPEVPIEKTLVSKCPVPSDQEILTFVDGGYANNTPFQVFENESVKSKGELGQNLQTLILLFDPTTPAENQQSPLLDAYINKPIYEPTFMEAFKCNTIAGHGINVKESYTDSYGKNLESVRQKYTQRNIPYPVYIDLLDFSTAKKGEEGYIQKGYLQTKEYLENHDKELNYQTFESFQALKEKASFGNLDAYKEKLDYFEQACQSAVKAKQVLNPRKD